MGSEMCIRDRLIMTENDSSSRRGWSFEADIQYTTCMIMNGKASDYPLMDEHVCAENA